ncbi:hypothetical protein L209DRAFT_397645 [Thermothelomyces heterothallicus CBS 203.75]
MYSIPVGLAIRRTCHVWNLSGLAHVPYLPASDGFTGHTAVSCHETRTPKVDFFQPVMKRDQQAWPPGPPNQKENTGLLAVCVCLLRPSCLLHEPSRMSRRAVPRALEAAKENRRASFRVLRLGNVSNFQLPPLAIGSRVSALSQPNTGFQNW